MTARIRPEQTSDLANDSIMVRTLDGIIASWNLHAQEIYGWTQEEAIGKISHDLLRTQFPKPLEEIESELIRSGSWEGKLVHTTRDGGRVVVRSRWNLERQGQAESVVEINKPSTDCKSEPKAFPTVETFLAKVANLLFIAGGSVCLLVALYQLYRIGWSGEVRVGIGGVVAYSVFPAVLGALFLGALKLNASHKVNLTFVCLSVAASVYGLEIFLTLSHPKFLDPMKPLLNLDAAAATKENRQKLKEYVKAKFGVDADVRNRLEVIEELNGRGIDAVPGVIPRFLLRGNDIKNRMVVLGGVADKLTVLCNESGQYVTYRSDEYGFHNPKAIWDSGRATVAALGDSYVQGYCVPSDRNIVALIRNRYPSTVNAGMAGDGPLLMLATFREYVAPLKPKTILWFYFEGNDLADLNSEKDNPLLRQYLGKNFTQDLRHRQSEIDRNLLQYIGIEKAKKLREEERTPNRFHEVLEIAKLGTLREKLGLVYGTDPRDRFDIKSNVNFLLAALSQVNDEARAWQGRVFFVYLPDWARFSSAGPNELLEQRATILNKVKTLGIPIIDIRPVFQAQVDPLSLFPFRGVGHYTAEGHKLVADRVLKEIPPPVPAG